MGQHVIRVHRLGLPQSARDVFALLAQAGWIEAALAASMQKMVGFRSVAVHDDQRLLLPILVSVIERNLEEFLRYSAALITRPGTPAPLAESSP